MSDESPCGALVREFDRDRYLTVMFAPPRHREALFALYAFNHEVAKTREAVSEPMLGQIRLQWWRDAVAEAFAGTPRRHPVAEALADTVGRTEVPKALLDRLIDAREKDLEADGIETMATFLGYAEATSAPLIEAACHILGPGAADRRLKAAARDGGAGYAMTGLLRALPFHIRTGWRALPADLLARHGLSWQRIEPGRAPEPLRAAVRELAAEAHRRLEAAREGLAPVERARIAAWLPISMAELQLRRLRRCDFDPFHPVLAEPLAFAGLRLAYRAWRRRL